MNQTILSTVKNVAKLGFAGGIIFGIGFVFVTQDPAVEDVGPAPATADITDFMGAPASKSAKFTEAMIAMGLKPRVYDFNGNVMYFATGQADGKKPKDILRLVQGHLVEYGVNKENHTDMVPMQQSAGQIDWGKAASGDAEALKRFAPLVPKAQALIGGDVVPTKVSENHVEMVGYDLNREYDELTELYEGDDVKPAQVKNLMGGYKYVDAYYEPAQDRTAISAVWSAEDFTAERMDGEGIHQSPPDPAIPGCMGCERDYRFQSLNKDEPFSSNMFGTTLNVERTYEFYRSAMVARGWTETGAQPFLNRAAEFMPELAAINESGRVLNFDRGDQTVQFAVLPDGLGGAKIMTMHQSEGAQGVRPQK